MFYSLAMPKKEIDNESKEVDDERVETVLIVNQCFHRFLSSLPLLQFRQLVLRLSVSV